MAGSRIQLDGAIKLGPSAGALVDYSADVASLILNLTRAEVAIPATYGTPRSVTRLGARSDSLAINFMSDEADATGVFTEIMNGFLLDAGLVYFSARWRGPSRTFTATTTNASTAITSAGGGFNPTTDVGMSISGTGITAGAYLTAVASTTAATLSVAATATGSPTVTVAGARSPQNPEYTGSFAPVAIDVGTTVGEWKMQNRTFPIVALQGPLIA